ESGEVDLSRRKDAGVARRLRRSDGASVQLRRLFRSLGASASGGERSRSQGLEAPRAQLFGQLERRPKRARSGLLVAEQALRQPAVSKRLHARTGREGLGFSQHLERIGVATDSQQRATTTRIQVGFELRIHPLTALGPRFDRLESARRSARAELPASLEPDLTCVSVGRPPVEGPVEGGACLAESTAI